MRNINAEPEFFKNYLDSKPFCEKNRFTGSSSRMFSMSSPNSNMNLDNQISVNKISKKISLYKTY